MVFWNKTELVSLGNLKGKNRGALLGAIFLMAQQFGLEIPKNIQDGVNTFVYILVLIGVINDPTTSGISDSKRALEYYEPSED